MKTKLHLLNLFFQYIINQRLQILQTLETEKIVLSGDNECYVVIAASSVENNELKSNQEEADTKATLHTLHVLKNSELCNILRSPSGDTNIIVLVLDIVTDHQHSVYYESNLVKRNFHKGLREMR